MVRCHSHVVVVVVAAVVVVVVVVFKSMLLSEQKPRPFLEMLVEVTWLTGRFELNQRSD